MRNRLSCFVIMPYSPATDRLFSDAILPSLRAAQVADILPLRADTMGQEELTLRAHIQGAVEAADFCIVDVTGSNPNVMFELGFAAARQKPLLVMVEKSAAHTLPANIRDLLLLKYDSHHLHEVVGRLSTAVDQVAKTIERSGRVRVTGFSASLFDELDIIEEFTQSARFNLSAVVGSADVLAERLLPLSGGADGKPLVVRVVCADPEGEFARIRAADSARTAQHYRQELWEALRSLIVTIRPRRDLQFELRLSQRALGTSIYLSDDVALVQPYLVAGASRELAGIVLFKGAEPAGFSLFQHQFGRLWAESTPAPTNDLMLGRDSS